MGARAFKFAQEVEDTGIADLDVALEAIECCDVEKIRKWEVQLQLHNLLSTNGAGFAWDAHNKSWRLWGLGWVTSDHPAKSLVQAREGAINYLVALQENGTGF